MLRSRSWDRGSRAKAKAAGAPVKVNISKIEPGQQMVAEWRGQPVFIVRRTDEVLGNLEKVAAQVADPESKESDQPAYVDPKNRSIKPELLVVVGLCTHLGCSPSFRPEVAAADLGADWLWLFLPLPRLQIRYGRSRLQGAACSFEPAGAPHCNETDNVIIIGVDQENA